MKLPDLFVNAVTTFDGKALAKGQRQIGGFEKSVKSLAKAFGVTFGAAALAQFGKSAVKAFAEDEAAATRLTKAVENLGLGFEDTKITRFIADLEKSAAVADDVLRPAFQSLISTTGSVTKSQDLLNLALEISAGTGIDAAEVAKDLSLAYLGQTKGLSKYNTGLSKTELAAAGFLTIQEKLTAQYGGQNAARLDTYAGKVGAVQIAYGNLQETVGGALIDAFMKLAGDTTTEDLTDSVDNLADSLAAVVELAGQVATPFVGLAKLFNDASTAYTKLLYKVTGTAFMGTVADRQYGGAAAERYKSIEATANAKARAAAEAVAAKRAKELLDIQKKSAAAALATAKNKKLAAAVDKANLALGKGENVFDLDKIQVAAALKNSAEALGKATSAAQQLQIANDVARLNVKRSMLELEDAIASKDEQAIIAATAKLNADLKILAAMTGQSAKLLDIKAILASLKPIDLINTQNLEDALARLGKILQDLRFASSYYVGGGYVPPRSGSLGSGIGKGDYIAPVDPEVAKKAAIGSILEYSAAATERANAFSYLLDLQNEYDAKVLAESSLSRSSLMTMNLEDVARTSLLAGLSGGAGVAGAVSGSRYAAQAANQYNVTVNAGVVGSEDTLATAVQNALLTLNRRGDSLATAGSL